MTDHRADPTLSRRRLLETAGVAGTFALAGCQGGGEDDELDVLHSWTRRPIEGGMSALVDGFEDAHPGVDANIHPIAGGGETTYEETVRRRLDQDVPPSSFAWRPGGNLAEFERNLGDAGADVRRAAELGSAHVPEVRQLCRRDDRLVAAPIGANRTNCLFYDVDVVEAAGVDPSALSDVPDLLGALERVRANTDATPLVHPMTEPRTTLQLFETVLLGEAGPEAYATYAADQYGLPHIRSALETVATIVENYVNPDAGFVWSGRAVRRLLDGDAAFVQQDGGTFVRELLASDGGGTYGEDWGVVPFPGTDGLYTMDVQSFVYPVGVSGENQTPEWTRTWLGYVGGREAQRLFNSGWGAVPTRTDVDAAAFGPYLADSMRDFRSAERRLPSVSRGLTVTPESRDGMERAVQGFLVGPLDVESAVDRLLAN